MAVNTVPTEQMLPGDRAFLAAVAGRAAQVSGALPVAGSDAEEVFADLRGYGAGGIARLPGGGVARWRE